jgi:UDP-3-O-[3-hydroxymyristoyl] glucosamine N-acyltransferase
VGVSLGDIAVRYNCELRGDPDVAVDHVATLAAAGAGALAFLANPAYRDQLDRTGATAVILGASDAEKCPCAALVTGNPYLVYARVAAELHPPAGITPGVHPRACVEPGAQVPGSCEVSAGAVIQRGAALGERVYVGPNAVIEQGVQVGDDTRILAGAVLHPGTAVGARCIVHGCAVLGADGFGNARQQDGSWIKVPQVGGVQVGDDVEIGAHTTIDRGAIGNTIIGEGVRLDNQVQVGHNVVIGAHTAIAALTGISGSTRIGSRCMVGGQVGFAGHLEVCDDVVLLGATNVAQSIDRPGVYGGAPATADDVVRWRRNAIRYQQLDDMARRLRRLEKQFGTQAKDD